MTKPSVRWNRFAAVVFLVLLFSSAFLVNQAKPETTRPIITIQQDGTVNPDSASIRRDGDTYTFTGNVYAEISVQKSNIIIDGAGYTLQGTYNGTNESAFMIGQGPNQVPNGTKAQFSMGIDLAFPSVVGVTIMNLNIKNFSIGIYIWTMNNTVTGNAVTESIVGILLSGSDNIITHNYIARNKMGVFFGWADAGEIPEGIQISHNSFDHNEQHLSGCVCEDFNLTETPHTWDDGKEGNFWSDYNGTDANGDGIGDKPYSIDVLNEDRYPLMNSPAAPPTIALQIPGEVIALTIAFAIVVVVAVAVRRRKKTRVKLST